LRDVIPCFVLECVVSDHQLSREDFRLLAQLKKPSPAKMTGAENHTLEETAHERSLYPQLGFVGKLAYAASLEGSPGERPQQEESTLDVSSAYRRVRDDDLGRGRLRGRTLLFGCRPLCSHTILTPAHFDLDADMPTVTVSAAYTKNRKQAVQPLPGNWPKGYGPSWRASQPRRSSGPARGTRTRLRCCA
jgi:hypothetical protein